MQRFLWAGLNTTICLNKPLLPSCLDAWLPQSTLYTKRPSRLSEPYSNAHNVLANGSEFFPGTACYSGLFSVASKLFGVLHCEMASPSLVGL